MRQGRVDPVKSQTLFGTDGIRGLFGTEIDARLAYRVGKAAGEVIGAGRVLVGRDTRPSGPELSGALQRGFEDAGLEALDLGVIPTGGISHLTAVAEAVMGVVISASHNPASYNGIKLLGPDGAKLSDRQEAQIAARVGEIEGEPLPGGAAEAGPAWPQGLDLYMDWLVESVGADLSGLSVMVDCANGAAYHAAPRVLRRLGVDTHTTAQSSDGSAINHRCGATHPGWVASQAGGRVGLALDGDADRLIATDETGRVVDGDFLMAILARHLHGEQRLDPPLVVATVMSNLGFRVAMSSEGIETVFTGVGDRYVREEMNRRGAVLGGEQSGHIIFGDRAVTGDGVLTAVALLEVMAVTGQSLAELRSRAMQRYPQVLVNVEVADPAGVEGHPSVWESVEQVSKQMGDAGRVLVRPSGTEPVVRVMVECLRSEDAQRNAQHLAGVIASAMKVPS